MCLVAHSFFSAKFEVHVYELQHSFPFTNKFSFTTLRNWHLDREDRHLDNSMYSEQVSRSRSRLSGQQV